MLTVLKAGLEFGSKPASQGGHSTLDSTVPHNQPDPGYKLAGAELVVTKQAGK